MQPGAARMRHVERLSFRESAEKGSRPLFAAFEIYSNQAGSLVTFSTGVDRTCWRKRRIARSRGLRRICAIVHPSRFSARSVSGKTNSNFSCVN